MCEDWAKTWRTWFRKGEMAVPKSENASSFLGFNMDD